VFFLEESINPDDKQIKSGATWPAKTPFYPFINGQTLNGIN
jgi:hypothetical protein